VNAADLSAAARPGGVITIGHGDAGRTGRNWPVADGSVLASGFPIAIDRDWGAVALG